MCTDGKHVARTAEEVDSYVSAVVVARLSRPDAIDLLASSARKNTAELHVKAQALRARLDELAALFADGTLNGSQLRTGSQSVRSQLDAVESEIAAASRGTALAGLVGVPDPEQAWEALDLARRRAVVAELMSVTLLPSHRGRRKGWKPGESYFDPSTVRIEPVR